MVFPTETVTVYSFCHSLSSCPCNITNSPVISDLATSCFPAITPAFLPCSHLTSPHPPTHLNPNPLSAPSSTSTLFPCQIVFGACLVFSIWLSRGWSTLYSCQIFGLIHLFLSLSPYFFRIGFSLKYSELIYFTLLNHSVHVHVYCLKVNHWLIC